MASPTKSMVADDVEIVRRILAHIDAGTTDEGEAWREPVENYVSPGRFAEELRLLRAMPSVFVPSATIPKPGDHVERVAFGVPLFAVRGRDQRARVFRNACRHRGFALVEEAGCSQAFVCRYHGWTYRLDGSLSHNQDHLQPQQLVKGQSPARHLAVGKRVRGMNVAHSPVAAG